MLVTCDRGIGSHEYGLEEGKFELPNLNNLTKKMSRVEIEQLIGNMQAAANQLNSNEMKKAAQIYKQHYNKLKSTEFIGMSHK